MPSNSTYLWQEGALIESFFLVRDGHFDEEGIVNILTEPGKYPGVTPSRKIHENLSDLKAQIAANAKGAQLIDSLMEEYGRNMVHFNMTEIQKNAELAVRNFLKQIRAQRGAVTLRATEGMDNGAIMKVAISIDEDGTATFDFTGTSNEMHSNMNAPVAITYSAIIYILRLLIGSDIPLNQGCLAPTKVIIPKGCFLNPTVGSAVSCGNTHTSQRLAELLIKAFDAAAASQGCMNCFAFFDKSGNDIDGTPLPGYGYKYGETICGGEGAGPTWHGASAVQIHMTVRTRYDAPIIGPIKLTSGTEHAHD